jgi:hypothetical protein
MTEEAARHIGSSIAWFGFWLMISLAISAISGEEPASVSVSDSTVKAVKSIVSKEND